MRARLFGACAVLSLAAACSGHSSSIEVTAPTAVKCEVAVANEMSGAAPPAGMSSTIAVTTTRDCTWTAASAVSWIAITSGSSGQGSGAVSYRVSANADPLQRQGTVDVNSKTITLVQ